MTQTMEEILANIDPKLRKKLQTGSAVEVRKQRTPSVGLNAALRGGLAYGRQIMIWGNKSAGKSSFCLQMVGEAQREGKVCAWVDSEMSFDPNWARRLGVDPDALIYSEARSFNDMVDVGVNLIKAGVDILVIDSISSLLPAVYFEKDSDDLKDLVDTKQIGAEARDMTNAVKMLNYANNRNGSTLIVFISQQRKNLSGLYASNQPTGGEAVKFFSSTVVKLWSSESESKAINGEIIYNDRIIKQPVGRKVMWTIDFNKTGPSFLTGEYDFYYNGEMVGVDNVGELLDVAVDNGIVDRTKNGLYTIGEETIHGRPKTIAWLREHENVQKELRDKLNA